MDLVSIVLLVGVIGWCTWWAVAFALYLAEHLGDTIDYYRERRLARKARANPPQPSLEDETSWLIRHDDVLLCLSQSVVADFTSASTLISPLVKSEPTGSLTLEAAAAACYNAVLQGTATVNDYRRLRDAVNRSCRS